MRLVFMAHDRPRYCGGPIINVRRLLPELSRRGHDVTCLLLHRGEGGPAAAFLSAHGVRTRTARTGPTEHSVRWILEQLADLAPDVFVPNIVVAGAFAGRWARQAGIPTIVAHVSDDDFNWGMAQEFAAGRREWSASGLFCISEELTRRTRELRPHSRLATIPHGSPVPHRTADQSRLRTLVYAGRLEERQKRISDVARSICDVLDAHPSLEAKFVGDGSRRQVIAELIGERGHAERVTFSGFVEPDHLYDELLDGQVLVLLSDFEGLPGAVIDAMMCGMVPVCRQVPGGLNELVSDGQTGLIVPDRGAGFREAIRRLSVDDELRRRLARRARERAVAEFSVDEAADRWERFCSELVADEGPARRISVPRRFDLPAVHPALAREDVRRRPIGSRVTAAVGRCLGGLAGRIGPGFAAARTAEGE